MFQSKSEITLLLESEIVRLARKLKTHDENSEEYQKTLDRIIALTRMKEEDKSKFGSRENLTVVLGNLVGIFMIIRHEHVNVITSRAMQLLLKPIIKA